MDDQVVFERYLHERCGGCRGGESCRKVAQQFSIGASRVMPRAQWFRRTGWVAVKPMGGARHSRLKDERDWRLGRTAASPDPPRHGGVARKRLKAPEPAAETPPRGSTRPRRRPCDAKRSENPLSDPRARVIRNLADFGLTRTINQEALCA